MHIQRSEDYEPPELIAEWEARIKFFTDLWRPRKIEEAERRQQERLAREPKEYKVMVDHGKRKPQGI